MPESLDNILRMSHDESEFTELPSESFIYVRFRLLSIFPRGVYVEFLLVYLSSVAETCLHLAFCVSRHRFMLAIMTIMHSDTCGLRNELQTVCMFV
jgi:hypothetical protein